MRKAIPIISIIGYSESGKTTLIEKLIAELKLRNISVGVVKHAKCGFDIDQEGKDSWRFTQSGADAVALASGEKIACIRHPLGGGLSELVYRFMEDVELVLAEGFSSEHLPKILIPGESGIPPFNEKELIAVVGDVQEDFNVPKFHQDDVKAIVDFILDFIQKQEMELKDTVHLAINGRRVPLNRFTRKVMEGVIMGMIEPLHGVENPQTIEISISRIT